MRFIVAMLALASLCACGSAPEPLPEIAPGAETKFTLAGDITRADHQTYKEIPFSVPRGVARITVEFSYTGKDDRTVIDLGLRDPKGQRGWSGGNKSRFTVSEFDATPSYMPGRIQPGDWILVLGIPNIREGQTSHYEAAITLSSTPPPPRALPAAGADPVISNDPGWRRGDFHSHTGHSDGSCDDGSGVRSPCAIDETARAARDARLDFFAITDHNTFSHREPMRDTQRGFPSLLLIPGTEITTFQGHANAIGVSAPLEFQLGSPRLPSVRDLETNVESQGAILSVNHPGQPSGEVCMGCGWTAMDADWSRIAAVEVINGSGAPDRKPEGPLSGIRFWENLLKQGYHITAIGGSDNHDPTDRKGEKQSPVGSPATVVWASELSQKGIIDGVKSGRVFIDVTNTPGVVLDAEGRSTAGLVKMGGIMMLRRGEQGSFTASFQGMSEGAIELVSYNLATIEPNRERTLQAEATIQLSDGASYGWIRAQVRNARGDLILFGNPVYVRAL
jgi:hypothetical protein